MLPSHGPRPASIAACAFAVLSLLPHLAAAAGEYIQQNITDPFGYKLLHNVTSVPAPLRIFPDQSFSGIDGSWNTFTINVGTPRAQVKVLASTTSQQIWAINRKACYLAVVDPSTGAVGDAEAFSDECATSRGDNLYNQSTSSTWTEKGYYILWIEGNLNYGGNGLFGWDTVDLGVPGEKGPVVKNTTVGTLVSQNFWLGHIGLHQKPTNYSAFEDPVPSYITSLYNQGSIPSMSFGYTAGARYHGQTVLASLTLGGYDRSRIIPNDLTFIMAPDNERDLVVGVVGLKANTTTNKNIDLLKRNDLNMFIDSTIAELWLPIEICKAFEDAFGLKYDNETDLYLVDDTLHQTLLAQNPTVTFTIGQNWSTATTLDIVLPYAAFDLEASAPYRGLKEKSRYFPLRRGNDSDQWVLGRTFLQEAYLTVDWERSNFSVSAVDWNFKKEPELLPIVSPNYAVPEYKPPKRSLSTGVIIGIAIGCGFLFALIMCAIGWWFWRRRHNRKLAAIKEQYEAEAAEAAVKKKNAVDGDEPPMSPMQSEAEKSNVFPKAELPGDVGRPYNNEKEKDAMAINEADNTEQQIFEMPGDMPVRQEAGGRQLSEKESMVVRERRINGIDPNGTPDISISTDGPRHFEPISPSEVALVNGRSPVSPTSNISPITPRTPSARDGAFLEANDTFFLPPYRARETDSRSPQDTLLSPISPLEGSTDASRRRFSYES